MAEHYVSEQEQVEQLKRWWKDNGKALIAGLVIGVGGLAGYRYWDATQTARAESASANYEFFLQVTSEGLTEEAQTAGRSIIENYPDSAYARLSALLLAKLAVDTGDYETAKAHLKSVIESDAEGEVVYIARARLARLLLAEGKADEAAAAIAAIPELDGEERFNELRGDVLAAQGEADAARSMYLKALAQATELGLERGAIQLKLDNLPGATEDQS